MLNNLNFTIDQDLSQAHKSWKILLLGDAAIDLYNYGNIVKLSPEAPVPIFVTEFSEILDGMAKNVENNLKVLGCNVAGYFGAPSIKTRFIDIKSKQHIMRLDDDRDPEGQPDIEAMDLSEYDAIVISDYDKGYIGYKTIIDVVSKFLGPVFIDTKKLDLSFFYRKGVFIKINEHEYSKLTKDCPDILVTLGKDGVKFRGETYPSTPVEVADVCGAGDTFLAALVYSFLETNSISEALVFANRAAAVTVKHIGVYAPTMKEINEA